MLAAAAVPLILWSGRWDTDLSRVQGVLLAGLVLVVIVLTAVTLRRGPAPLGSILVVLALAAVAIGGQVLQNGRGLLGSYGQFPFRAAYVDFNIEQLMRSKVAAEDFVLAQTSPGDRIGIWTDPDRLTAGIAAMQLWGWYNNVGSGATMGESEAAELARLRPTALAMYAPDRAQILQYWSSLPPQARASAPECTSVPFLGIGSPEAHVCVTHLAWG